MCKVKQRGNNHIYYGPRRIDWLERHSSTFLRRQVLSPPRSRTKLSTATNCSTPKTRRNVSNLDGVFQMGPKTPGRG